MTGGTMPRRAVTSAEIARPVGPFSPAVESDGSLYLSGQVAQDPVTGELIDGDAAAQTEQILRNAAAVLRAGGKSLADVVKVGVFLTDMADFQPMNAIYARHFEAPYPARTTVGGEGSAAWRESRDGLRGTVGRGPRVLRRRKDRRGVVGPAALARGCAHAANRHRRQWPDRYGHDPS